MITISRAADFSTIFNGKDVIICALIGITNLLVILYGWFCSGTSSVLIHVLRRLEQPWRVCIPAQLPGDKCITWVICQASCHFTASSRAAPAGDPQLRWSSSVQLAMKLHWVANEPAATACPGRTSVIRQQLVLIFGIHGSQWVIVGSRGS